MLLWHRAKDWLMADNLQLRHTALGPRASFFAKSEAMHPEDATILGKSVAWAFCSAKDGAGFSEAQCGGQTLRCYTDARMDWIFGVVFQSTLISAYIGIWYWFDNILLTTVCSGCAQHCVACPQQSLQMMQRRLARYTMQNLANRACRASESVASVASLPPADFKAVWKLLHWLLARVALPALILQDR